MSLINVVIALVSNYPWIWVYLGAFLLLVWIADRIGNKK
jgi:hypothetical protein